MTDGPLLSKGQRVRGHEFHWSIQTGTPSEETALYAILERGGLDKAGPEETRRKEGFRVGSVAGSYIHLHMGTDPSIAPRFVQRCASAQGESAWLGGCWCGTERRLGTPRGVSKARPIRPCRTGESSKPKALGERLARTED